MDPHQRAASLTSTPRESTIPVNTPNKGRPGCTGPATHAVRVSAGSGESMIDSPSKPRWRAAFQLGKVKETEERGESVCPAFCG